MKRFIELKTVEINKTNKKVRFCVKEQSHRCADFAFAPDGEAAFSFEASNGIILYSLGTPEVASCEIVYLRGDNESGDDYILNVAIETYSKILFAVEEYNLTNGGEKSATPLPKLTVDVFKDAPEWAKYAAVDANGAGFFYLRKPYACNCGCGAWQKFGGESERIQEKLDASDWENSLIERPNPMPELKDGMVVVMQYAACEPVVGIIIKNTILYVNGTWSGLDIQDITAVYMATDECNLCGNILKSSFQNGKLKDARKRMYTMLWSKK